MGFSFVFVLGLLPATNAIGCLIPKQAIQWRSEEEDGSPKFLILCVIGCFLILCVLAGKRWQVGFFMMWREEKYLRKNKDVAVLLTDRL